MSPEEFLASVNFVELFVALSDVLFSEAFFMFRGLLVKLLSNAIPSDPFSLTGAWLYVRAANPDRRNKITISRLTLFIRGSFRFKLKCASLILSRLECGILEWDQKAETKKSASRTTNHLVLVAGLASRMIYASPRNS
jgi:hypothetical protein